MRRIDEILYSPIQLVSNEDRAIEELLKVKAADPPMRARRRKQCYGEWKFMTKNTPDDILYSPLSGQEQPVPSPAPQSPRPSPPPPSLGQGYDKEVLKALLAKKRQDVATRVRQHPGAAVDNEIMERYLNAMNGANWGCAS